MSQKPSTTGVHSLPTELLIRVFEEYFLLKQPNEEVWNTIKWAPPGIKAPAILGVCHHWTSVIESCPKFWSDIRIDFGPRYSSNDDPRLSAEKVEWIAKHVNRRLALSKQSPVSLLLVGGSFYHIEDIDTSPLLRAFEKQKTSFFSLYEDTELKKALILNLLGGVEQKRFENLTVLGLQEPSIFLHKDDWLSHDRSSWNFLPFRHSKSLYSTMILASFSADLMSRFCILL